MSTKQRSDVLNSRIAVAEREFAANKQIQELDLSTKQRALAFSLEAHKLILRDDVNADGLVSNAKIFEEYLRGDLNSLKYSTPDNPFDSNITLIND